MTALLTQESAATYVIRPIAPQDNVAVADLIRTVMTEFGAVGEGYSIMDPEVDAMYEAYQQPRSAFAVAESDGVVAAGAGIMPLKNAEPDICELQKMYILVHARGRGLGGRLLDWCLAKAREAKFKQVYIETLAQMTDARRFYEQAGFKPLAGPLGNTGHYKCDRRYVLPLMAESGHG